MGKTKTSESWESETNEKYIKRENSWPLVLYVLHLNILGIYGLYVALTSAKLLTSSFSILLAVLGILGACAGSHRLWAHRTYKANGVLRLFLMLCQTLTGQGSIYSWVQAHRFHHKYFKTSQDPHMSDKDFISAQFLAPVLSYSREQTKLLKEIDMSDLEEDKIVMFQHRFYWILVLLVNVLLPINAPLEYWGDSISNAILVAYSLRQLIVWNVCCLINSAHFIWGLEPDFKGSDSNSVFFLTKTHWPQYHYLLPNDYQSDEFGDYARGFTTAMIRVFAALDMATDLKTISSIAVRKGLTKAMETDREIAECIQEEAKIYMEELPKNHFLNREKFM